MQEPESMAAIGRLAAGVYFLRFTHESGRTTSKVIVE